MVLAVSRGVAQLTALVLELDEMTGYRLIKTVAKKQEVYSRGYPRVQHQARRSYKPMPHRRRT